MECSEKESVKKFYANTEIFITGASGFIGKVLLEKLLRSCGNIKTIHLLMRAKKGVTVSERIKKITNDVLFDQLKAQNADALEKINIIEGDCVEIRLGISDSDYEKLKNCSVIFHVAASVRFDDPLKRAILLNTRGTREICELARGMPNLKSFVHVSTAFIEPRRLYVEEKLYPAYGDWRTYINYAETLDEDLLNSLATKLTNNAINTYVFTKNMSEDVIVNYRNEFDLPISIIRPSIVAFADFDPIVGWCDSFNTIASVFLIGALGLEHFNPFPKHIHSNTISVDLCARGIILAGWRTGVESSAVTPVYNAASIREFSYTIFNAMSDIPYKIRSNKVVSPCYGFSVESPLLVFLCKLFVIWIPALVMDFFFQLFGQKPRVMKVQRTVQSVFNSLSHFLTHQFAIDNFKFWELNKSLSVSEREEFEIAKKGSLYDICEGYYRYVVENTFKESKADQAKAKARYPLIAAYHYGFLSLYVLIIYKAISLIFFS